MLLAELPFTGALASDPGWNLQCSSRFYANRLGLRSRWTYQASHVASRVTFSGALASDPDRNLLCSSVFGGSTRSRRMCLVESHVASRLLFR